MEGHRLGVKRKRDWGRGFILLLLKTAALPSLGAGSNDFEPASGFVIKNYQFMYSISWQCRLRGTQLKRGPRFIHSQSGEGARSFCTWTIGIAQHWSARTLFQAV